MTGRVVVVTGGTRGIGRALAEGYACAGAKVAVVGRNEADCKETERHLRDFGGDAIGFAADMGRLEDLALIVERTVERVRRDRCPGEQRRDQRAPAGRLLHGRGVAAHFRHQREGPCLPAARGAPTPQEESSRCGAEHPLDRRFLELSPVPRLRLEQGGPFRAHTGRRCRAGAVWNPGQRARPGALRHRADPRGRAIRRWRLG